MDQEQEQESQETQVMERKHQSRLEAVSNRLDALEAQFLAEKTAMEGRNAEVIEELHEFYRFEALLQQKGTGGEHVEAETLQEDGGANSSAALAMIRCDKDDATQCILSEVNNFPGEGDAVVTVDEESIIPYQSAAHNLIGEHIDAIVTINEGSKIKSRASTVASAKDMPDMGIMKKQLGLVDVYDEVLNDMKLTKKQMEKRLEKIRKICPKSFIAKFGSLTLKEVLENNRDAEAKEAPARMVSGTNLPRSPLTSDPDHRSGWNFTFCGRSRQAGSSRAPRLARIRKSLGNLFSSANLTTQNI